MEEFSCCSRWQEYQAEKRCVQEGNNVISREEYLQNCRLARRYQTGGDRKAQVAQVNKVREMPETEQMSIFI